MDTGKDKQNESFLSDISYFTFIKERIFFCSNANKANYELSEKLFSYSTYISISSKFIQIEAEMIDDKEAAVSKIKGDKIN